MKLYDAASNECKCSLLDWIVRNGTMVVFKSGIWAVVCRDERVRGVVRRLNGCAADRCSDRCHANYDLSPSRRSRRGSIDTSQALPQSAADNDVSRSRAWFMLATDTYFSDKYRKDCKLGIVSVLYVWFEVLRDCRQFDLPNETRTVYIESKSWVYLYFFKSERQIPFKLRSRSVCICSFEVSIY